ncbi:hypothetical protein L6164_019809 [Bauhinia variegata]|uniref:Uncharacterized protein n=1 Tax=Bauhinia variegata TaxID=167791 RepID=A0ACB9MTH3_BAUVA|nr:hypothetical protein L6164_019809 [Bauhinia variegata]
MVSSVQSAHSAGIFWRFFLFLPVYALALPDYERSLSLNQNTTLKLSHDLSVGNSPGSKSGTSVLCERVHIHGRSRLRNLSKFCHSMVVKVFPTNSDVRLPNVEICFHRNVSLGVGMCPHGQWEKAAKGYWHRSMSPFDHKILDIRTAGSTLENFEVSIEEDFFLYRIVFLILGIMLMNFASFLSQSLAFYYSSAMTVGIVLVILMILYQGMKLLPTGRKSSLAIFLYSSAVGFGTFLLRYVPDFFRSVLMELGINEDMLNPLAIFLLAFIAIAGAWLGFWVVHKLVLTEDGSVDISTSQFVAWAIRIVAAIMILQSSMDPLLGTFALSSGLVLVLLKRILRLKFLRRCLKSLFKSSQKHRRSLAPDSSPFDDSNAFDEYMDKMRSKEDSKFRRSKVKRFTLAPCKPSHQGFDRTPPKKLSEEDTYPSTFHTTPERKKFSKVEWETFTQESTEKALEELVASPDFSKWLVSNADRISVTPNTRKADRRRRWLFWS